MAASSVHKLEADVEIKASSKQFHDMFTNKPHLVHHTCYDKIQGCELLEGEWGQVGAIIYWSYFHDGKAKKAKDRVKAVDPEKNLISFEVIDGDVMEEYKSFVLTIQASTNPKGSGSVVHWTMEYEMKYDHVGHPETLLEFMKDISKDIDKHLAEETMAAVHKLEADVEIKASPEQFHDMLTNKPHHLHHTCYDKIQGCELLEGEWGQVGSIIYWSYFHDGKAKKAKDRVKAVDLEKNLISCEVIDGDLMEEYKSFVFTIQASPNPKGSGSIVHWTLEYEMKYDHVDHPETVLEFVKDVSKDIDKHLAEGTMAASVVHKLEADVEIKASPEQFHDMLTNKPHHVHHTCYDKVQGCELHEGEWGQVGAIVYWSYFHDGKAKKAKDRIKAVDLEKNLISFEVIDGDLMEEYKSFVFTFQASPNPKGSGSIVHYSLEYEMKYDHVDHPETLLEFVKDISKDMDKYLAEESQATA